jgi:hypothetical protein
VTVFQEELEEWCEEYDNEFSDLDELHTLLSGLDSLSYYVGMVKKRYRTSSEQQNRVLFFREKSAVFKIFLKMAVFFRVMEPLRKHDYCNHGYSNGGYND